MCCLFQYCKTLCLGALLSLTSVCDLLESFLNPIHSCRTLANKAKDGQHVSHSNFQFFSSRVRSPLRMSLSSKLFQGLLSPNVLHLNNTDPHLSDVCANFFISYSLPSGARVFSLCCTWWWLLLLLLQVAAGVTKIVV